MRDAQGLDAGGRDQGPSLSHGHSPVCLSNQILSSMTQMIQRGWGQLKVWYRKVKDQVLKGSSLPFRQAHKYGELLRYTEEWLTQQARPVHCPSAPMPQKQAQPWTLLAYVQAPIQPHSFRHRRCWDQLLAEKENTFLGSIQSGLHPRHQGRMELQTASPRAEPAI